jgi:dihydrolipoyl dehydrogenase
MSESTQLVVIGAGPGGHAAAFLAADLGLAVTLVDEEVNPGGVCTYRGCIPSKALLHVAKLLAEAKHAPAWGIDFGTPTIDIDKLRGWKDGIVQKNTGGLGQLAKLRKVRYIRGRASFVDAHTLSIASHRDAIAIAAAGSGSAGDRRRALEAAAAAASGAGDSGARDDNEQRLTFETCIIATGSRPLTLPNAHVSAARLLDSTSALDLARVPKTLLVVGGGYIGLELGTVYAALGSSVSVVEMTDGLLPGADRDLVTIFAKRASQIFSSITVSTKVVRMDEQADGVKVTFERATPNATASSPAAADGGRAGEQTFDRVFDQVLVAIGRRPNGHVPGLDRTRVEVDARGFIKVDAQRRTAEPSIYAIGDVAGEPMLAHKATHEGRLAVEAIAGHKVAWEPRAIPAVVFTDPEIAWCGLTETEAKKQGIEVAIAKFPWGASGRATTLDRNDGLTKLIIDPTSARVLGVGIVGVGAGELISEGVLAVEMAALASDVELSIHPHPTLSETIMEAAEVFYGHATDFYRPRRS